MAGNMDPGDSVVNGGVLIEHQIHEGKHQYEVRDVVKYKKGSGGKAFASKGDKLMEINGTDLEDVTPEELAQMLAEGNPMLTVSKPSRTNGHTDHPIPDEDTLYPVSKESIQLSFSLEMMREDETEENEVGQEEEGQGDESAEDDCLAGDENGEEGDLLIISMTNTSISVVRGRGYDDESTCPGCTVNDVVLVSESSTVTLVPRGSGSFREEKESNVLIKNVASHQYIRSLCSQRTVYTSPNPETITIYSYKSNTIERFFRGMPVVLNCPTESNCFLKCCKQGDKVFLQVETCEKQRLKQISKSDESALSFVFYMKADRSKQRKFESALHLGWFIRIANTDLVEMGALDGGREERSFLFIIQK